MAAAWVLAFVVLFLAIVAVAAVGRRAPPQRAFPEAPEPPLAAPPLAAPLPCAKPSTSALVPVRARAARRREATRVVFAHGFGGFDVIRVLGSEHRYFRGLLGLVGDGVHFARVPAFAGVAARAERLAHQIESLGGERVHLVAHSMGGLDARWAIARLGLHERVASLTTIGTPHYGTPLADAALHLVRRSRSLARGLARIGLSCEALADLSVAAMRAWNHEVADVPGVHYASYVTTPLRARDVAPPLLPPYALLAALSGDNDGVVPAWSQPWGDVRGRLDADHWGAVGWSRTFDAPAFYAELVRSLRTGG